MGLGKALRTGVMCAVGTAFTMAGVAFEMPANAQPTKNVQSQMKAAEESYNLKSIDMTYAANGDVTISFIGVSEKDPKTNKYKTGSELKTIMRLTAYDIGQRSVIARNVHDVNLEALAIEFTDPMSNNRGNVSGSIAYTSSGIGMKNLGFVDANLDLETSAYSIGRVSFHGEDIPITINGKSFGRDVTGVEKGGLERAAKQGRLVAIDYNRTSREVFPPNSTPQLPGIREKLRP